MRLLKEFVRLIQSILILSIPFIILYWILSGINLEFLKPFKAILDTVFNPFISFTGVFFHLEIPYDNKVYDLTPLVFALIVLVIFMGLIWVENLITNFENTLKSLKAKARNFEVQNAYHQEKTKFSEELAKNKVIYLLLKFRKRESTLSYLSNNEDNKNTSNKNDDLINEIIHSAVQFNAKVLANPDENSDIKSFIFYNIDEALDYSFFVYNKIMNANANFVDLSTKLNFSISCHCSYSESTSGIDIPVAEKILSLCGTNEILISELFRNKYQALKVETNLLFDSKGIYNIDDKQIEVFQIKVAQQNSTDPEK